MTLHVTRTGDHLVVDVEGQLTVGNRQAFKDGILEEIERGARLVVLDCAQTTFIDSSGLGAIVSVSKRLRTAGGELRLCGLNADLQSLFELTRLDALFPRYETRDDALAG